MGAQLFFGSPQAPAPTRITNAAAAGDLTVIAASAGKKTRVYSLRVNVAGACIVQVKDGAGTVLEVFNFAGAGGGVFLDLRELPYYTTTAGNALIINASAAVQVDGVVESFTAV